MSADFIYGIDPGTERSGYVLIARRDYELVDAQVIDNPTLRMYMRNPPKLPHEAELCVEFMVPRGMPTSAEEMRTMFELGRIVEAWGAEYRPITRQEVKMAICGTPRAKDANIRAAIIDIYGGEAVAIGGKKCGVCKGKGWLGRGRETCPECSGACYQSAPGPLKGVTSHAWQALGVALTAAGVH